MQDELTDIQTLSLVSSETELEEIIDETLCDPSDIFNFSLSGAQRMSILLKQNESVLEEIVRKLECIYNMTPLGFLKKFLCDICHCSKLPYSIRLTCSDTLFYVESSQSNGLESLNQLVDDVEFTKLHFAIRVKYIIRLIKNGKEERVSLLHSILCRDDTTHVHSRFREIKSLKTSLNVDYMLNCCIDFLDSKLNWNWQDYIILACQLILSLKESHTTFQINKALKSLSKIALSNSKHEIRADASDNLLRYDSKHPIGKQVLDELRGNPMNLYEDEENVHTEEIQSSSLEVIKYLNVFCSEDVKGTPELDSFETCRQFYLALAFDTEDFERIQFALRRIEVDSSLTSGCTLKHLFKMVHFYIERNQHRTELQKRMLEELTEMSGTCSSGYCTRLLNVLSGFGECSLSIGWQEQIKANLMGRLNAILKDEADRDLILEQMTNIHLADRKNFLEFFARNISTIKENMYDEFKTHLSDDLWDLYFKEAIIHYEQ